MPKDQKTGALNFSESEIRYAMANSQSNRGASLFLKTSLNSYRKYAKLYKDEETGLNLYDLHKNQAGKNILKGSVSQQGYYRIWDILSGKHSDYAARKLKPRLIKECIFEEKCSRCGFDERRVVDYSVPLLLNWIDGNKKNHHIDNLELLCYNCFFLTVDNVVGRRLVLEF